MWYGGWLVQHFRIICLYVSLREVNFHEFEHVSNAYVLNVYVITMSLDKKKAKHRNQNHLSHTIVFYFIYFFLFLFFIFLFLVFRLFFFCCCLCFLLYRKCLFCSCVHISLFCFLLSGTYHIHYVSTSALSFSTPLKMKYAFSRTQTIRDGIWHIWKCSSVSLVAISCISNWNQYMFHLNPTKMSKMYLCVREGITQI